MAESDYIYLTVTFPLEQWFNFPMRSRVTRSTRLFPFPAQYLQNSRTVDKAPKEELSYSEQRAKRRHGEALDCWTSATTSIVQISSGGPHVENEDVSEHLEARAT